MSKIVFSLILSLCILSCHVSQDEIKNSEYFSSEQDSIHAENIENNLIPMFSVSGKIKRMTIPEMMQKDSIPGVSLAFVDNGQITWTKHYGYANLLDSIPINSETIFTGASLSKPITAIAALGLVEEGLLELDADINEKLSEWKVPENEFTEKEKVTLRRLIGHQSGIKNDLWNSYLPHETVPTLNQLLSGEPPSTDPAASLIFEPGSRTKYSNTGYSVLQKLLMDITNDDFNTIIDKNIFEPLGMKNSIFLQPIPEEMMRKKAIGYNSKLEPYSYKLFPYQAAGGVWTTPTDLAKFLIALLDDYHNGSNTLVSKEMAQSIFTKETMRYVFSLWNWGNDIVFLHHGSNQGFNCMMYGSTVKNQGLVVMTNSDNAFGFFDYLQRAINHEYDWEYVKPEILDPIPQNISWIEPFLGEYTWRKSKVSITAKNNSLAIIIDNENHSLSQTDERVFVFNEHPIKVTFPSKKDGNIIFWESDGYPYRIQSIQN